MPTPKPPHYGKFRGIVLQNLDPLQLGRILVQVPSLPSTLTNWALPCIPFAGTQSGCFVVPPIGSHVWIEFEQGNPDHPIWTGGFWQNAADIPTLAIAPPPIPPGQNILLQTAGQNALLLSDVPASPTSGGILLKSVDGATLRINAAGIFLDNAKGARLTMIGPKVDINNGGFIV